MAATIMDGKKLASEIKQELKKQLTSLEKKPILAVILVGDYEPSRIYVRLKERDCKEIGLGFELHELPVETDEEVVLDLVNQLNGRQDVEGILVQLPLPPQILTEKIINSIEPCKDADGLTHTNLGRLFSAEETITPATAQGVIRMLEHYQVNIPGSNAVVIGRSRLVGRPIASMLLNRNATVTSCHSKTKNLKEHTLKADIIISAVGKPGLVTTDMVKDGAAVVDVGITRTEKGLIGDVEFEGVSKKASIISPVPGGVGPMTRAMVLENTLKCFKLHKGEIS